MEEFKIHLQEALALLGIQQGDILYVSSDLTRLLSLMMREHRMKLTESSAFLHMLTDTFIEMIGSEGTLLFPIFDWGFCKGLLFDIRSSKGSVGSWNNWILENRSDYIRTRHPMYSFLVYGKDAELLGSMDNQESFGADSPFAYLHNGRAKQLFFDVTIQRGLTYLHYVEQSLHVPYRYHKYFIGKYIDNNGEESVRCYSQYVRDLSIHSQEYLPDSFFEENGVCKNAEVDGISLCLLPDLGEIYDLLKHDYQANQGEHCYRFENYTIDWNAKNTHSYEVAYKLEGGTNGTII